MKAILVSGSALLLAATLISASAQTSSSAPPVSSQTIQETQQNHDKKSKVVLQRSIDENGETVDGSATAPQTTPAAKQQAAQPPQSSATQLAAENAERAAVAYTDFDLDVRLRPAESHLAVRGLITVRNDGKTPLAHLPLQLSSELNWELIRIAGREMPLTVGTLNSDADHTGQLHEAAVTLPTPLAPGASLQVDVTYSGSITESAKRLLAIGTPEEVAATSDWDRISTGFTGLRGFGNVVWYPVSSVPVILGDGARLFDEIGSHKRRLAGAHFRLALTIEIPSGLAPTIALVNGQPVTLSTSSSTDTTLPAIAMAHVDDSVLGFEAPSLFLANRTGHPATNMTLWTRPESNANVTSWSSAAAEVTPFLQGWLGVKPRSQLTVLDLPEDGDTPFETGSMLATPVRAASVDVLDGVLAHALTHAWVMSPRAWLSEGVAHFMGTLWIEKKQGRERALQTLDNARSALALAEPESPGESDGQPLVACISPVYYRTKATYVFWMLRDLVSDATLSAALREYDPAKDTAPEYFESLIEQAGQRRALGWFFADWVYKDKGLPDLSIESIYPSPASAQGSYLVAVNLANNGYAAVEAPVQVITESTSVTQRVLLQARSKSVQRILIQGSPTEVRLNDGTIPETQATIHSKTIEPATPKP
ncbi:MAG TPA: hypothetical protein VHZ52_16185 [Acidobacteriaceae bacterium]|jgi:hypothetical protein|nr:hypothetical protein [Acidobacteriaceae bacterium]